MIFHGYILCVVCVCVCVGGGGGGVYMGVVVLLSQKLK